MRIYSWNVNGIRAAVKNGFVDWFNEVKPEVLCLQETRVESDRVPEELSALEGYFCYWNSSQKKKGANGSAILSQIEPDAVEYGFGTDEFDGDGRVVQLVFPDWVLNSIYFPNGNSGEDGIDYKLRFYDAFLENSLAWLRRGRHVVTLGDYNTAHLDLDVASPQEAGEESGFLPVERAWIDKYVSAGFDDAFRLVHPNMSGVYTWWPNKSDARERNEGMRVDYAFVDSGISQNVADAQIYTQIQGSDHCPTSVDLDLPFPPIVKAESAGSERSTRKNPVV